jgi:hypothetical protein
MRVTITDEPGSPAYEGYELSDVVKVCLSPGQSESVEQKLTVSLPAFDIAAPPAASMIEALRGVGYSPQAAIADLIDNSITAAAGNVWINFWWEGRQSYISILDDGHGMNEDALRYAMCPGNRNPLEARSPTDLGRFGLGLKTASFSQCRSLTVASAENGRIAIRRWDLDHVAMVNDWQLLKEVRPGSEKRLSVLNGLQHGTMILWEILDRITGDSGSDDRRVQDSFLRLTDRVEQHLAMVFHRFLEGPKPEFHIFINGDAETQRIKAWDPFMGDHPCTISTPLERIFTSVGTVELQGFVLPHKDRLDEISFDLGAGPEGWTAQQGFYVYRNQRLLVSGSWLGLGVGRTWTKEEPFKLARIRLDIPNSADAHWKIDIRKSTARPPDYLRYRLRDLADQVRNQARRVFAHRGAYGKRPAIEEFQRAWEVVERKDHIAYRISRNHPSIGSVLDDSGELKSRVEAMLRVIEETVPVQQIWLDTVEKGVVQDEAFSSSSKDDVIRVLHSIYDHMVHGLRISPDEAREYLLRTEPFHNFPDLVMSLSDDPHEEGKF